MVAGQPGRRTGCMWRSPRATGWRRSIRTARSGGGSRDRRSAIRPVVFAERLPRRLPRRGARFAGRRRRRHRRSPARHRGGARRAGVAARSGALGPFELAYVTARGRLVVRDGDTGRILWSTAPGRGRSELMWSADGRRLLVLSSHQARTYSAANGALISTRRAAGRRIGKRRRCLPTGGQLALVLGGREVVVIGAAARLRQVLAGPGVKAVSWSPDGRWLLVTWPAANQWVFVRVAGAPAHRGGLPDRAAVLKRRRGTRVPRARRVVLHRAEGSAG